MPLKIESGTYTVNPPTKKNVSKFLLWKHWRRSVHEDRDDEERRRASGKGRGGGEVAGLEDVGESCAATVTSSVPGVGGIRSNRRTRPLSLAVQPLNYHRLDPDPKPPATITARHHPNMTSQESIGSCSLDVDRSVSDRSENNIDSVSERTLHSLNLSNGEPVSPADNLPNGSSETLQKSHITPDEKVNVSNGHRGSPEPQQLTAKKPSYLGLACSVSGYSGITRYDSKLREGFRSRDSSPGTRLIPRDTSPAGFRFHDNLGVPGHHYPTKSQSISPLAMDRQNGFTNGLKEECKIERYMETRSSISICQGFSEVDKGGPLHATFPDISPICSSSPAKRSPGIMQVMSCGQQNKSFSGSYAGSSPKGVATTFSTTSFSDTVLSASSGDIENQRLNTSSSTEKSFVQQRVERLYGPGALAQGFFFKRSTTKLNSSDSSFNKSNNNNDISTDNANTEESLKNLPVLRHLRPEFRAQLPVVSHRKPTDGSEQIIKPLQRISPVSRKPEQKPKTPATLNATAKVETGSAKLNASVTSIPDQQPAAPKVVLPVLEPSASATNIAKQAQEAEKKVEEKDGHYFMKILKQETDRLLSLAASAEAELVSGDPNALPEEAAGKLRSAAGKARLLASQKMQQFEGLCQKNIIQVPGEEFPTTNEDLAGFWDMVMLQVVQVNELFEQIDKLRSSQWQEVRPVNVNPKAPSPSNSEHPRTTPVPEFNDSSGKQPAQSCASRDECRKECKTKENATCCPSLDESKELRRTLECYSLCTIEGRDSDPDSWTLYNQIRTPDVRTSDCFSDIQSLELLINNQFLDEDSEIPEKESECITSLPTKKLERSETVVIEPCPSNSNQIDESSSTVKSSNIDSSTITKTSEFVERHNLDASCSMTVDDIKGNHVDLKPQKDDDVKAEVKEVNTCVAPQSPRKKNNVLFPALIEKKPFVKPDKKSHVTYEALHARKMEYKSYQKSQLKQLSNRSHSAERNPKITKPISASVNQERARSFSPIDRHAQNVRSTAKDPLNTGSTKQVDSQSKNTQDNVQTKVDPDITKMSTEKPSRPRSSLKKDNKKKRLHNVSFSNNVNSSQNVTDESDQVITNPSPNIPRRRYTSPKRYVRSSNLQESEDENITDAKTLLQTDPAKRRVRSTNLQESVDKSIIDAKPLIEADSPKRYLRLSNLQDSVDKCNTDAKPLIQTDPPKRYIRSSNLQQSSDKGNADAKTLIQSDPPKRYARPSNLQRSSDKSHTDAKTLIQLDPPKRHVRSSNLQQSLDNSTVDAKPIVQPDSSKRFLRSSNLQESVDKSTVEAEAIVQPDSSKRFARSNKLQESLEKNSTDSKPLIQPNCNNKVNRKQINDTKSDAASKEVAKQISVSKGRVDVEKLTDKIEKILSHDFKNISILQKLSKSGNRSMKDSGDLPDKRSASPRWRAKDVKDDKNKKPTSVPDEPIEEDKRNVDDEKEKIDMHPNIIAHNRNSDRTSLPPQTQNRKIDSKEKKKPHVYKMKELKRSTNVESAEKVERKKRSPEKSKVDKKYTGKKVKGYDLPPTNVESESNNNTKNPQSAAPETLNNELDFPIEYMFHPRTYTTAYFSNVRRDNMYFLNESEKLSEKYEQDILSTLLMSLNSQISDTAYVPLPKLSETEKRISKQSSGTYKSVVPVRRKSLKSFENKLESVVRSASSTSSQFTMANIDCGKKFSRTQSMNSILDFDRYLPLKRNHMGDCHNWKRKCSNPSSANFKIDLGQMRRSESSSSKVVPEKKPTPSAPQNGTSSKRRVAPVHKSKPTATSEANKKAREAREQARRQMIEERRRAIRSKAQNAEDSVTIFAPET